MAEQDGSKRYLTPEQERRRRRRSVAMAVLLGLLAVLFYIMALVNGPSIMNRPL